MHEKPPVMAIVSPNMKTSCIKLRGVRQNNLKNLDLDIPLGKLVVVTGLSGTGKSSLVFDTLHAEGQRRYVETFSPYTRQFMELLARPQVDSVENIRPSIALRQGNSVRTSRSTVGTMTELCDHFKNWFPHVASLHDPQTGEIIHAHTPQSIWKDVLEKQCNKTVLMCFEVNRPASMSWEDILQTLQRKGYARVLFKGVVCRIQEMDTNTSANSLIVIQDRVKITSRSRSRFLDACQGALRHGHGALQLYDSEGAFLCTYREGLRSPHSGETYSPAKAGMFSFNSPVGACPHCRGFGRVIEIDYRLVIPDENLSLNEGAIRPFQGEVYQESLRELQQCAHDLGIPMDKPWRELTPKQQRCVIEGDPDYGKAGKQWPNYWYGVRRFFDWLESKSYKMHVRVFLSKYRTYNTCPVCQGTRLKPEALLWTWREKTLPELYQMPVGDLLSLIRKHAPRPARQANDPLSLASQAIINRLGFLEAVGLGYLTLDRTSRTLSGGEVERVHLTACLGNSLVDTLFILDEPSIGLHTNDIARLVGILRKLTEQGNTVVVVEHDEAVMRAADHLIELGPVPGEGGGEIVASGKPDVLMRATSGITAQYLSGQRNIPLPKERRRIHESNAKWIRIQKASKHNICKLDIDIPLHRLVVLTGISGSGKSTLMNNVLYQGFRSAHQLDAEEPAECDRWISEEALSDVVLVDQSPVGKTPRSNPALYAGIWNAVRDCFAAEPQAQINGLTAAHFSFNHKDGRCEHCEGLGYERVEMQFLSEVYVPCPVCEGKRFRPEVLEITHRDKSVSDVLAMTVSEALAFFSEVPTICKGLETLKRVGLQYLRMGQPVNTLSGGESQRLKLVRYLARAKRNEHALILLDEPTTGLHRHDIATLVNVLQVLVEQGHSLCVIEHQMDLIKCADWVIELGPGAGEAGGNIVFTGTPEALADADTASSAPLREALNASHEQDVLTPDFSDHLEAAEKVSSFIIEEDTDASPSRTQSIQLHGAREHNLKNLSLSLPRNAFSVITGVSGSGKSTLAFDILFAEGQRRFLESISSYARQFVEQLRRPDIDQLEGIPPTVAIEQRVTHGTRKSTVATVTEVAQYLRLLYAQLGVLHSPHNDQPLVTQTRQALLKFIQKRHGEKPVDTSLSLCAPLVRSRKGHHQPLANWASEHGYETLRCDGKWVAVDAFQRLDRYREHDVELLVARYAQKLPPRASLQQELDEALRLGKGSAMLIDELGNTHWLSTCRTDPVTGEAYPELDAKHFSWNSPKGWCPRCQGYGTLDEAGTASRKRKRGSKSTVCPDCGGARLNALSRAVRLELKCGQSVRLPELLSMTADEAVHTLGQLKLDKRGSMIAQDIIAQVQERLAFLASVGLNYLTLDRATATLSGGEAQRIRLAAQLGSTLSGVLYVLDEPSIGLHARDNARLLDTLDTLQSRGNTLVVVEHNAETMRRAGHIVDLGPGAGIHGGELIAAGDLDMLLEHERSLTGRYLREGIIHPLRGAYRSLPQAWHPRRKRQDWLVLRKPTTRNLKGDDLRLPLKRLCVVCGISGAGKSTLVRDTLMPAVNAAIAKKRDRMTGAEAGADFKDVLGVGAFRQVIEVDQEPIGKTPRSTPATYIGAYDLIRAVYASLPEAKMQGYNASTFSFNTTGGRCENCGGAGQVKMEMTFLPDTYVTCEDCNGTRFGDELAEIRWNDKNIAEVLEMSFVEAVEFFHFHERLKAMMSLMVETGLGYLRLGQSSPTLSGGEAQRLKLVSELVRGLTDKRGRILPGKSSNLYLLEEPTIGLHLSDCEKLIGVLHRLVDEGHTVLVIEHHTDIIAEADYVVEIGPEGGESGGEILYQGDVAGLRRCKKSRTAPFLPSGIETSGQAPR